MVSDKERNGGELEFTPVLTVVSGAPPRVMIVDDVEWFRKTIRTMLEMRGYHVVGEAASGEEAVPLALELKPDIITMDLIMSGMDGVEAIERIRGRLPNTKIVMITQESKPSVVMKSLRAGADNFLMKPFDEKSLFFAVRKKQ